MQGWTDGCLKQHAIITESSNRARTFWNTIMLYWATTCYFISTSARFSNCLRYTKLFSHLPDRVSYLSKYLTSYVDTLDARVESHVDYRGDHALEHAEHTVEPQGEQHQEEQYGPQLGHRELVDRLSERYKRQARARGSLWETKNILVLINLFMVYMWRNLRTRLTEGQKEQALIRRRAFCAAFDQSLYFCHIHVHVFASLENTHLPFCTIQT